MRSGYCVTNDGVKLHYLQVDGAGASSSTSSSSSHPLILLHGWSASSRSFNASIERLAAISGVSAVFALDMRFHGESDKPEFGFHVSRLACDFQCLLESVVGDNDTAVVCGTSMGSSVIWSYIELFGSDKLAGCVFVDQAPCQYLLHYWKYGSKGIFDDASVRNIRTALMESMEAFAEGNEECCVTHPIGTAMSDILKQETMKCKPEHLANLMDDHARLDWRPIIQRIHVPVLNLYGTNSGCFPVEGMSAIGDLLPSSTPYKGVPFIDANHWLYIEFPDRFVSEVASFISEMVIAR